MGAVLPKVGKYAFLSIICLLINVSVFFTGVMAEDSYNTDFIKQEEKYTQEDVLVDNESSLLTNFAFASGGSFIPFFSLLPLTMYADLPPAVTVITGIIIGIIGAFQIFLLAIIILNLAPRFIGSGFDV